MENDTPHWSDEKIEDPLVADARNFCEIEK